MAEWDLMMVTFSHMGFGFRKYQPLGFGFRVGRSKIGGGDWEDFWVAWVLLIVDCFNVSKW